MKRFHINEKGEVKNCDAMPGFCPISSIDGHYSTKAQTQEFYENFMENLQKKDKTVKFHFISGKEKHAFTKGDCAHLAKLFQKDLKLPIYYLGDKDSNNSKPQDKRWSHFVNKLPDGRFIDVEGVWTKTDLLKRWKIDELGSGWIPDSINPVESIDLRKMGVESRNFTESTPSKTLKKIKSNIGHILINT